MEATRSVLLAGLLLISALRLGSVSAASSYDFCTLFDSVNASESKFVLNGLHLQVAATPWRPFVITDDDGNIVGGHDIELLREIALRTGFTFDIHPVHIREDESTWNDVMFRAAKDYDILGQWWIDNSDRRERGMVIGKHVVDASSRIVTARPGPAEKTLGQSVSTVLAPFSYGLWGMILLLILLSSLFMWWLEHSYNDTDFDPYESRLSSLGKALWLGFSSLTGQAYFSPQTTGGRIFSVAFSFVMLITVAAYTANLANFLVMQTSAISNYHSLDDVFRAGKTLCMVTGSPANDKIREPYPSLNIFEVSRVPDIEEAIKNGTCVAGTGGTADLDLLLAGSAGCDLHLVGSRLTTSGGGFAVDSKDCKPHLMAVLDAEYQSLVEEGFPEALWQKYATAPSCPGSSTSGSSNSLGMDVSDLSGVMLMLLVIMIATGVAACFVRQRMWRVKSTVRRATEFAVSTTKTIQLATSRPGSTIGSVHPVDGTSSLPA